MFDKSEMQDIDGKKVKILAIINEKGPSLPVQLSREMAMSPILVSAIIAEMHDHDLLKLSNMKVGGSPLYYVLGQEEKLDAFAKFLPQKEKETFELLKKNQILEDEKVMPAERVALRSMKDFAVPIKVTDANSERIFWRFHTFSEQDSMSKIHELLRFEKPKLQINAEKSEKPEKEKKEEKVLSEEPKRRKSSSKKDNSAFVSKIKEFFETKNIGIEKIIEGKDFSAIVSLDSDIGKIKFLAVAKNKKKPTTSDILLSQQQANQLGLPVLFLVNELPKQDVNFGPIIFKKID
ncbi:hypothetical protein COS75_01060 [Candidatus Pacearchaeota archaeon CG06_land_8_20_14_3_00_35_12]|nr:MAG: hypothetical protein COS75_01060 [Candidatus Pacearchaeota archaeon CG06_land_8_20_14_3_00_35_12]